MMTRLSLLALSLLLSGCDQAMEHMPRYGPYESSSLFADGSSARPRVEGAVAAEDDLAALAEAVREAARPSTAAPVARPIDLPEHGRRGHLRVIPPTA